MAQELLANHKSSNDFLVILIRETVAEATTETIFAWQVTPKS
jgi:hypothetical protein